MYFACFFLYVLWVQSYAADSKVREQTCIILAAGIPGCFVFWHSANLFSPNTPHLHFTPPWHFRSLCTFLSGESADAPVSVRWCGEGPDLRGALPGQLSGSSCPAAGRCCQNVAAASDGVARRRNSAADGWASTRLPTRYYTRQSFQFSFHFQFNIFRFYCFFPPPPKSATFTLSPMNLPHKSIKTFTGHGINLLLIIQW